MFLVYLKHRGNRQLCFQLWQDILRAVASHPDDVGVILSPFLDAAEGSLLPDYLKPESGSLDDLAGDLLAEVLSGSPMIAEVTIIRRLLRSPGTAERPYVVEICLTREILFRLFHLATLLPESACKSYIQLHLAFRTCPAR